MTEDQLLDQLPIPLTTEHVQQTWPSGKALRKWAAENSVTVMVSKGSVLLSASGKDGKVVDEFLKTAERVKARL